MEGHQLSQSPLRYERGKWEDGWSSIRRDGEGWPGLQVNISLLKLEVEPNLVKF